MIRTENDQPNESAGGQPAVGGTAGLQLKVKRYLGQTVDDLWTWPLALEGRVSLEVLLFALGHLGASQSDELQYCAIERGGNPEQPIWRLINANQDMRCMLNGEALAFGSSVRLNHGDGIEFGFAQFEVLLTEAESPVPGIIGLDDHPAPHRQADAQSFITGPSGQSLIPGLADGPSESGTVEDSASVLRDLVRRHEPATLKQMDADAGSSALLDLFASGTDGPRNPAKHDFGGEASWQSLLGTDMADQAMSGVENPHSVQAPATERGRDPDVGRPRDLLDDLHQRYLQRLRAPHAKRTEAWQQHEQVQTHSQQDEFARLRREAGEGSLHEFLSKAQATPSVISNFDDFGASEVLAPETFDSILHLFAPQEYQAEPVRQPGLPDITRREHHHLSIDSDIDLNPPESEGNRK